VFLGYCFGILRLIYLVRQRFDGLLCISGRVSTVSSIKSVEALQTVVGELRGEGRGWILFAVASGWFLTLGTQLIFPAILPYLRAEFGLDLTTAGFLLTALWTTYAICQFPSGLAGDRLGSGRLLLARTIGSAAVVALLAIAPTVGVLFGATVLYGLVTSPYGPARYAILSDMYADRDGTAIGVTLAAGNVGNSVLPVIAGVIATYASWRLGFGVLIPLFVLVAIALRVYVPPRTGPPAASAEVSLDSLRYVFTNVTSKDIFMVVVIQTCAFFTWQGFAGFYPTYLVEVKSLSPSVASVVYGSFFAVGIVVQPTAGAAMDRFGIKPCLYALGTIIVLALTAVPFVDGFVPIMLLTVGLSSILGFTPVTHTYLSNHLPSDMKGRGLGLLRTGFMTVSGAGPLVVGSVADRAPFDYVFYLLAGVCLCALLLVFAIPSGERE